MGNSITTPIKDTIGQYVVDRSIVPKIREAAIEFQAHDLKPYSNCNFFLNDTNVNGYVQPASSLTCNLGVSSNIFSEGEGLYCNTTHAYCSVIDTSLGNVIYLNENYVSVNLTPYGPLNSNSFTQATYNVGDIVYLANNTQNSYSNTFQATVAFWNAADGSMAVKVKYGVVSNVVNNVVLFKVGSNQLANIANTVIGNKFPVGAQVSSTKNVNSIFLVSAYNHLSGVIAQTTSNTNQLVLSSTVTQNVVNSNIQLTSGYGVGQNLTIISIQNNVVNLNSSIAFAPYTQNPPSTQAYYAIGPVVVDDVGKAAGIFDIPEDENLSFDSGDLLFTINDSSAYNAANASMRAIAIYAAIGQIASSEATTPVVTLTPTMTAAANSMVVTPSVTQATSPLLAPTSTDPQASLNPMAQTFFVPTPNTGAQNYGIFVSSINLFFQRVPQGSSTQFPVTVKIVETENGYPTSVVLGSTTVEWADINVTPGLGANANTTAFPDSANSATYTNFAFSDPIYLNPGSEYAIVVYSESPDYSVWTSVIGDTVVNSTRLVSQNPFVGSFFQAQNASAWNSIPNMQLMFVLNKAQFSTTPTTLTFNLAAPSQNVYMDMAILHSADLTFPLAPLQYQMITTLANTGLTDAGFFNVDPNIPYDFGGDLKNSTIGSNRRRVISAGNANSTQVQVIMSTANPDISPMFNAERLSLIGITNIINPGSIANTDLSIYSAGNHINANNIVVTITAPSGDGGIQATANVLPSGLSGNSLVAINIINPGAGYVDSPFITISEPSAPANAKAYVFGEDNVFGGNGVAKYVTRQITLADGFDAGDLVVYLNAVRPQGTDIQVYYKAVSGQSTTPLSSMPWVPFFKQADVFSPDQKTSIPITFVTGIYGQLFFAVNNVQMPQGGKFKSFAIKIAMFAADPTVVPLINSFACVAVPAG